MACVNFDELLPGSRVTVYPGQQLDAVELTMVVTGKEKKLALQDLRRIPEDVFESFKLRLLKLPGEGNRKTKTVHFRDAIELVMVLPGKLAKESRKKFADIILRYFAGDQSLAAEIESNAASDHPVAQLARETLALEQQAELKRSREQADIMFELEVQERRERIVRLRYENQQLGVASLEKFKTFMSDSRPDWERDTRLVLLIEDSAKNIVLNSGSTAVVVKAADGAALSSTQSLSISQVAQEMKVRLKHGESTTIGKRVAKAYREGHNDAAPPKHRQWVDGAERLVNSYTEEDRPLIETVMREWIRENRHKGQQEDNTSDGSSVASSI